MSFYELFERPFVLCLVCQQQQRGTTTTNLMSTSTTKEHIDIPSFGGMSIAWIFLPSIGHSFLIVQRNASSRRSMSSAVTSTSIHQHTSRKSSVKFSWTCRFAKWQNSSYNKTIEDSWFCLGCATHGKYPVFAQCHQRCTEISQVQAQTHSQHNTLHLS